MKRNAIIIAGTHGCRKLSFGAYQEYKQYAPLGNKLLIECVIDAALHADSLKNIFVCGEVQRLRPIIEKKYRILYNKRLFLVQQGDHVIDNILLSFLHGILIKEGYPPFKGDYQTGEDLEQYRLQNPKAENENVVLLCSDVPFLSPRDIDYFVETSPPEYDFVYGLSTEKAIATLLEQIRAEVDVHLLKLGTFPIYREAIRFNNLCTIKPLRISPHLYRLSLAVYHNRVLLTRSGKGNICAWRNIAEAMIHYTLGKGYRYRVMKGISLALWYGVIAYAAHATRNNKLGKMFRWPLKPTAFEEICFNLSGGMNKVTANITNIVTSVMDIDGEEMYSFLTDNNYCNFKRILKYTYK